VPAGCHLIHRGSHTLIELQPFSAINNVLERHEHGRTVTHGPRLSTWPKPAVFYLAHR